MNIPTVENPRRRRKHRKGRRGLTAAQRAAGFGGKAAMSGRRYRRRRNPLIGTLAANPRRRRRYRTSAPRRYRRHRNPSFLSGFGGITKQIQPALWVGVGILGAKMAPRLIQKVWAGAPTTGIGGYAVQAGGAVLLSMGVRMVTKSSSNANLVLIGGLGYVLFNMANEYLLPQIGLAGLADDSRYVTTAEVEAISGYQIKPDTLGAYVPSGGAEVYAG